MNDKNTVALEARLSQRSYLDDVVKFIDIRELGFEEKLSLRVSEASLYEENEWNFEKEFDYLERHEATLNFRIKLFDGSYLSDKSNENYLEQVKDFYYTLLTDPISSRPKFTTYKKIVDRGLKWLISYMRQSGIKTFSEINQYDAEEFLNIIATTRIKRNESAPITNRTLTSRAAGVDWLFEQRSKMKEGLNVDIFEEYGDRTRWSTVAAEKVLGRRESNTVEMPDEVAKQVFECALSDFVIADCLSDIYQVDKKYKNKEINYQRWRDDRKEVYLRYGYWSGNFDHRKRETLECRLRASCYSVIALLTGMRLHEVLNIPYGIEKNWCNEIIELDGQLLSIYFVKTKTTKLEPMPKEYQWQTVPIVRNAIEALEKAHERYFDRGSPWLFPSRTSKGKLSKGSVGHLLKEWATSRNIRLDGQVWNLASHQFRKKFARIMVRQGLGLRALQDQLKHYDIEMTKLYGDPNLYADLQAEKFELSEELMEEFIGSQVPVIGGGAEEIEGFRKEFRGMAKKDRERFLKSLPSQGLVEQTDDGLCFYRAKKALCGGDKLNCRPADCNNSFMVATGKKKTLIFRKEQNNRLIQFFKSQPLKVAHLRKRNQEIDKLLSQLISIKEME